MIGLKLPPGHLLPGQQVFVLGAVRVDDSWMAMLMEQGQVTNHTLDISEVAVSYAGIPAYTEAIHHAELVGSVVDSWWGGSVEEVMERLVHQWRHGRGPGWEEPRPGIKRLPPELAP